MTSLEEKEMLELEECCFRPRINKPKKRKNSNNSHKNKRQEIFEKLYRYNEKYKLAKELRAIELEKIAGQKITFIPSTNFLKKSNKKLIKKVLLGREGHGLLRKGCCAKQASDNKEE